jgi:hypothetical protein
MPMSEAILPRLNARRTSEADNANARSCERRHKLVYYGARNITDKTHIGMLFDEAMDEIDAFERVFRRLRQGP